MQCNDARLFAHAYIDNELDAGDSIRLTRHMADCPECSIELRRIGQLKKLLQKATPASGIPDTTRARILAALPSPAKQATPVLPSAVPRARPWRALPLAVAASMLVLLGGGTGVAWQQHATRSAAMVADVVSDHLRSLQSQHLTDVLTSDQHTVKPWFDGKLDFSPQVRSLDAAGFVLVGGRLDVLHGQRVAAIVYRRRQHPVNVFQFAEPGRDSEPVVLDAGNGYTTTHWRQDGIVYWAVSTIDRSEMQAFADAFRKGAPLPAAK